MGRSSSSFPPTLGYLKLQPASSLLPSKLLKTTDGGTTWRDISPVPVAVGETCFVSALVGWAVVGTFYSNTVPNCYGTTDGGATWQPRTVVANGSLPNTGIQHLAFADAQHGVASNLYDFYTTSNGGISWQQNNTLPIGIVPAYRIRLLPSGAGWMVGSARWLAYTTDFGATWTPRSQALTTPGASDFTKIQAFEPGHAWAFVPGSPLFGATLAQTTRRGAPWRARAVSPPTGTSWSFVTYYSMHFADRDTGFVHVVALNTGATSSGHYVLRTADAGITWASSTLPLSPLLDASGLAFYHATRGLLFGERGRLWLTTDGARTWQPRPSGTTHALRAATWVDARTVLAIGDSAAAIKSTDGGLTWQPMPALSTLMYPGPSYAADNAISVVSPQIAFVVAPGNGCYRTADGGTTWARVSLPQFTPGSGLVLYAAAFDSPTTGRALADDGAGNYVLNTVDAGITWTLSAKLTNGRDALTHLALTDRYNDYAAGGGIVRYSEKYLQTDTAATQRRSYCAGEVLAVGFTATGSLSANPADYRLQLSNSRGRFRPGEAMTLPPAPGSTLATWRATLPATLLAGTRYRVRVALADNTVLGGDNQRDLTINALAQATIAPSGPALNICQGSTLQLSAPAGLAQYQWNTGATTRAITVAAGGSYTVQVATVAGCLGSPAPPVTVSLVPVPTAPLIQQSPAGQLSVGTPGAGVTYQWFFNGGPLVGATQPVYPATGAAPLGTYTVVAVAGGCTSPPSRAFVVVLATKSPALMELGIYPNPARTRLTIERFSGNAAARVEVLDALGRCQWAGSLPGHILSVAVQGWSAGLYLVRVLSDNGEVATQRVLIQP